VDRSDTMLDHTPINSIPSVVVVVVVVGSYQSFHYLHLSVFLIGMFIRVASLVNSSVLDDVL